MYVPSRFSRAAIFPRTVCNCARKHPVISKGDSSLRSEKRRNAARSSGTTRGGRYSPREERKEEKSTVIDVTRSRIKGVTKEGESGMKDLSRFTAGEHASWRERAREDARQEIRRVRDIWRSRSLFALRDLWIPKLEFSNL